MHVFARVEIPMVAYGYYSAPTLINKTLCDTLRSGCHKAPGVPYSSYSIAPFILYPFDMCSVHLSRHLCMFLHPSRTRMKPSELRRPAGDHGVMIHAAGSCCRHWMVERLLLNAALLAARAAAPRPAFSWDTVPYFVHCQTPLPCPPRAPPPGPGPSPFPHPLSLTPRKQAPTTRGR